MTNGKAAGLVVLLGVLVAGIARALKARTVPVPRDDLSSVGEVEQVGPMGNTDPGYTFSPPNASTSGNQRGGIAFDPDVQSLCECAPLQSFGPKCEGYTWLDVPLVGRTDFRSKLPARCGR